MVFFAGGYAPNSLTQSNSFFYDATTAVFTAGPALPNDEPFEGMCSVRIDENTFAMTGGFRVPGSVLNNWYIYDARTGLFTEQFPSMPSARDLHACGMVQSASNGPELVIVGGNTVTTDIFNFGTRQWRTGPNMADVR